MLYTSLLRSASLVSTSLIRSPMFALYVLASLNLVTFLGYLDFLSYSVPKVSYVVLIGYLLGSSIHNVCAIVAINFHARELSFVYLKLAPFFRSLGYI